MASQQLTIASMLSLGFRLDARAGLLQLEGLTIEAIREVCEDWKWRLEQAGTIPSPKTRGEVLQLCGQLQIRLAHQDTADAIDAGVTIIYPRIAA